MGTEKAGNSLGYAIRPSLTQNVPQFQTQNVEYRLMCTNFIA